MAKVKYPTMMSIAKAANKKGGKKEVYAGLRAAGYTTAQTRNLIKVATNPRGKLARGGDLTNRTAARAMRTGTTGG